MVSEYSRVRVTSDAFFPFIKNLAEAHGLADCVSYRLLLVAFRELHNALGIATASGKARVLAALAQLPLALREIAVACISANPGDPPTRTSLASPPTLVQPLALLTSAPSA
jgi:hypothetical protein